MSHASVPAPASPGAVVQCLEDDRLSDFDGTDDKVHVALLEATNTGKQDTWMKTENGDKMTRVKGKEKGKGKVDTNAASLVTKKGRCTAAKLTSSADLNVKPQNDQSMKHKLCVQSSTRQLVNVPKPTGDPKCPKAVKMAKQINQKIEAYVSTSIIDDTPLPSDHEWHANDNLSPSSDDEPSDSNVWAVSTKPAKAEHIDNKALDQLKAARAHTTVGKWNAGCAADLIDAISQHYSPANEEHHEEHCLESQSVRAVHFAELMAQQDDHHKVAAL
ncbi:hypothetical protein WOLCODRAFT_19384 [Wolfiporia cocos MD-104 SS10]|uniref:Uncharacterized protein n=1 Tax=Wolfiporia cocos (strain MD-104) TaxID=742152 RepID=A0A2H3JYR3_WOLCO|nr:hypothetical protein WOLCODRAFT_19384 [Wolfiporia cocos MD-104 SS10]